MKTALEIAFALILAAPYAVLLGTAIADEYMFRKRFGK